MTFLSTHIFKSINRKRLVQYLASISATLGMVSIVMHYGWPSPYLPILINGNYTFKISQNEGSWLTIMPFLGAIPGALVSGIVIDTIGRKRMILYSTIPFLVSWLMIALANNSIVMHIARFLAGMTDGLSFTAVPMYLGEIAEAEIRGLLGSFCPLSVVTGFLIINILGCYLPINVTAFIALSVPAIQFASFAWMPESPYFLLMKKDIENARTSLRILRGTQNVEKELERLTIAVRDQNTENKGKLLDLFTVKSNRKAVIIVFGLRTIQQCSGTNAIAFYCKTIFTEAKDFLSPNIASIIYFTIQLIMCSISSAIVDKTGRKPLLLISTCGAGISLCINGTYLYFKQCTTYDISSLNFVPMLMLILFIITFSIGLQTIPVVVMGEIFSTNIKAIGLCMSDIHFAIVTSIVSKYFHATTNTYGMFVPFFTFFVCCIIGVFFILFLVPETKGKTLEDIQTQLKCKK